MKRINLKHIVLDRLFFSLALLRRDTNIPVIIFAMVFGVVLLTSFQNCSPFNGLQSNKSLELASSAGKLDGMVSADMSQVKSVTLYDINDILNNRAKLESQIEKAKQMGFNTVWIVVTWQSLEPNVGTNPQAPIGSAEYGGALNNETVYRIKETLALLKKNKLNVIWSLNYLGEGWSPIGVNGNRLATGKDRDFFLRYARFVSQIIKETQMEEDVFLMFHDEGILGPYDELHADTEIQQTFRNFLYARNKDLSYWNNLWKSSYSDWSEVKTFSFNSSGHNDPKLQDTIRFINMMIRENISKFLKNDVKSILPLAKLGFHYTNFSYVNHLAPEWIQDQDLPFVSNFDYDFISLAYYDSDFHNGAYRSRNVLEHLAAAKKITSTKTLFVGELGSSVCGENCTVQGSKTVASNTLLNRQANFLKNNLELLLKNSVGFNIWNLQDFDFAPIKNGLPQVNAEGLFGLYDANGSLKPSGKAVFNLMQKAPEHRPTATLTYHWSALGYQGCSASPVYTYGDWSSCQSNFAQTRSALCLNTSGNRTRHVQCMSSKGNVVADSLCTTQKPATEESCEASCLGAPITTQYCQYTPPPAAVAANNPVASLPAPIIQKFGKGCTGGNCIWVIGENLRPGCRVDIYKEDWSGLHKTVPAICQNSSATFEVPADLLAGKMNFHFTVINKDNSKWSAPVFFKN